ncbi:MAG: hypothetical protein AMK73_09305 [Planctomycetes bacterium SM23_32]|nr:MAG: hypothetical protein AMK73_09305 [Planctomycetes bacterium SM23_32]
MHTYPSLYADISTESGYNGLTRDPHFGAAFLCEFQQQLLLGTDICSLASNQRHSELLRGLRDEGKITKDAFDSISWCNADWNLHVLLHQLLEDPLELPLGAPFDYVTAADDQGNAVLLDAGQHLPKDRLIAPAVSHEGEAKRSLSLDHLAWRRKEGRGPLRSSDRFCRVSQTESLPGTSGMIQY